MPSSLELASFRGESRSTEPGAVLPPIYGVNDFNDDVAPAECITAVHDIFDDHQVPDHLRSRYHGVHDVPGLNIVAGASRIYQLVGDRYDKKTVFVGVVDPGVGTKRKGIVVETDGDHTFVGPDNGLLSLGWDEHLITAAYSVNEEAFRSVPPTFHGRDIFYPLAAALAVGVDPKTTLALEPIDASELTQLNLPAGTIINRDGLEAARLWQRGIPTHEGQRANAVTIRTGRVIFDGLRPRRGITARVVDTFEDVPSGGWLVYEGSMGRRQNTRPGHVDVAIRDRVQGQGAGRRLRTPIGGVVSLEWHFNGGRSVDNGRRGKH